ncbi:MAG: hypothetical protein AAF638_05420, partial [Pseudomonadota bacterium]
RVIHIIGNDGEIAAGFRRELFGGSFPEPEVGSTIVDDVEIIDPALRDNFSSLTATLVGSDGPMRIEGQRIRRKEIVRGAQAVAAGLAVDAPLQPLGETGEPVVVFAERGCWSATINAGPSEDKSVIRGTLEARAAAFRNDCPSFAAATVQLIGDGDILNIIRARRITLDLAANSAAQTFEFELPLEPGVEQSLAIGLFSDDGLMRLDGQPRRRVIVQDIAL